MPGRTTMVGKPQAAAVEKALARVVVDQVFTDHFLRSVGGLRVGRDRIVHHRRQFAAEHGQRTGVYQPRRGLEFPAGLEQIARAVEVDAVAEIEIGLGARTDHRGEMENRTRIGIHRSCNGSRLRDVAFHALQPGIGIGRECCIEQLDSGNGYRLAVRPGQRFALQQPQREPVAEESSTSGDEHLHAGLSRERKILRQCRRTCGTFESDVRVPRAMTTAFGAQRVNYIRDVGSAHAERIHSTFSHHRSCRFERRGVKCWYSGSYSTPSPPPILTFSAIAAVARRY